MSPGTFGILWGVADSKGRAVLLVEAQRQRALALLRAVGLPLVLAPCAVGALGTGLHWVAVGLLVLLALVSLFEGSYLARRWHERIKEIEPTVRADRARLDRWKGIAQ